MTVTPAAYVLAKITGREIEPLHLWDNLVFRTRDQALDHFRREGRPVDYDVWALTFDADADYLAEEGR